MTLKKATAILSVALCGCLLSGCSNSATSASSLTSPPSISNPESCSSTTNDAEQRDEDEAVSPTTSSAPSLPVDANESDGAPSFPTSSSPISDNTAGAAADSSSESIPDEAGDSSLTDGLIKYDSVTDIPFIELEITTNGKDLYKNGQPWASTPGTQRFGNLCFSDGTTLYIQCFLSENQDDGFRWYWVCFDHWHEDAVGFLPEETYNKLFTHADGYTLYTDDGYQYTVTPCELK